MPLPSPSPSAVPVVQHWEAFAAACAAAGRPPALAAFATWLAERVAVPAPVPPSGLARARAAGAAAVQAWRSARALRARYAAAAPAGGPSPDEFLLLYFACKRPGSSKSDVFGYAGLGAATGGQMLSRLAGRGWLAEGPDPADGRRTRLAPTPAGQAAFAAAAVRFTAAAKAWAAALDGPDLLRFEQLLGATLAPAPQPVDK